jgi:hypothetical protein
MRSHQSYPSPTEESLRASVDKSGETRNPALERFPNARSKEITLPCPVASSLEPSEKYFLTAATDARVVRAEEYRALDYPVPFLHGDTVSLMYF